MPAEEELIEVEQTIDTDETGEQEAKGRIDTSADRDARDVGEGEVGDTPTPEEEAARLEEMRAEKFLLGHNVQRLPVAEIIVAPDVFQSKEVDESESGVNKAEKLGGGV